MAAAAKFNVGELLECDTRKPEGWPFYYNIIQQCRIIAVPTGRGKYANSYKVKMEGIGGPESICYCLEEELYRIVPLQPKPIWEAMQTVYVKLPYRVGTCIDGSSEVIVDTPGTWARATIIAQQGEHCMVSHTKWDSRNDCSELNYTIVHYSDIRSDFPPQ